MRIKLLAIVLCLLLMDVSNLCANQTRTRKHSVVPANQVASFVEKKNAAAYMKKLRAKGTKPHLKKATVNGETVYRIYVKKRKVQRGKTEPLIHATRTKHGELAANTEYYHYLPASQTSARDAEGGTPVLITSSAVPPAESVDKKNEKTTPPDSAGNRQSGPEKASGTEPAKDRGREVEIGKFDSREDAEAFVNKISERGYVTILRPDLSKEGKPVYRVFVLVHGDQEKGAITSLSPENSTAPKEQPVGTVKAPSNIFQQAGRNVHAALSLSEIYTDNAFDTATDKKSGYVTLLSPEIWILLPRYFEAPLAIEDSSTRSPGGLFLTRLKPNVMRRYYTFFSYKADVPILWHNYPGRNTITHDLKGRFIYNFGAGLYLDVIDQFSRNYETRATNISVNPAEVDKYKSNLFNSIVYYDAGNRFRLRLDYANFFLSYDDPANDYRDRTDNSFSGYVFYKLKPKTSLFVQYTFTDISYRSNGPLDSHENMLAGGLQWDFTAKSSGIIKAGYEIKDFYNSDQTFRDYILELQVRHKFNPKNYLIMTAFRRTNETDINIAGFIITHGLKIDYQHLFSPKITGFVDFQYSKDRYQDLRAGNPVEVQDDTYQASGIVQYTFKRWLKTDLGYTYTRRDSNIPDFNFTNNTVILRLTGLL